MDLQALASAPERTVGRVDRHPVEPLGAVQVTHFRLDSSLRAAVWHTPTGSLVWDPGDALDARWIRGGKSLLLLRGSAGRRYVEHVTWPGKTAIGRLEVRMEIGAGESLEPSPAGDLVALVWQSPNGHGYDLVQIDPLRVVAGGGFRAPEAMTTPKFSPDGGYLVCCVQEPVWWVPDRGLFTDYNDPSDGGTKHVGRAVVRDTRTLALREADLFATISAGWRPAKDHTLLEGPVGFEELGFRVQLPTGEVLLLPFLGDPFRSP
jgi:hypothetical protein